MCGITARVGRGDAIGELIAGLESLEYRGYDSAGVAVKNGGGLKIVKQEGDISRLKSLLSDGPTGAVGIGHTRWSTHGAPTDANAHPHTGCDDAIAVVHNGIIENHAALRAGLEARGHEFASDTDTEVVPHLLEEHLHGGASVDLAFRRTVGQLEGSFAIAMVTADSDAVFATRQGSPLVLGVGDEAYFLASDVPAFLDHTDRVAYLDDGDVAVITPHGYLVTDHGGAPVERSVQTVNWDAADAEKRGYDHYMLKEIHEQPSALAQSVRGRISPGGDGVELADFPPGTFADVEDVQFVACGTSYHAAMYARQLLHGRGVSAQTFRAGEYATNPAPVDADTLVVGVTQSGETADTLESLRRASRAGARTLALTNVVGSTAARECDDALFIRAGPEIGVAATKTFSSQVATLLLFIERLTGDVTGSPSEQQSAVLEALGALPGHVEQVLDGSPTLDVATAYRDSGAYFFIGRGTVHPVALEGALKFKEITYEHAEGFAAGQLKHGPLALVTPDTPVVAIFSGRHDEKTLNNVKEVQARGAPVIGVANEASGTVVDTVDELLPIPETHPDVAGVLANVQLQLISYHVADLYGRAIDKPRNLAKSVTVE